MWEVELQNEPPNMRGLKNLESKLTDIFFRRIFIKKGLGGDTIREVAVERRRADEIEAALWNRDEGEPLYDFDVLCETCGAGDRGETLLLCDGCDLGFHLVKKTFSQLHLTFLRFKP